MEITLNTPLTEFPGVGEVRAKKLEKLARGRGRRGALPDAGPGRAAGGAGAVRCAAAGDSINL